MSPSSASMCFSISFRAPTPTVIFTLSLHDALPICLLRAADLADHHDRVGLRILFEQRQQVDKRAPETDAVMMIGDRKSTRLNSSHQIISYAVFCLKKKRT